jgi:N-acetylated-alpha-linked acidic dipeptidase
VHLRLAFDWKRVPARDVIAKLPGYERPEEWVIRGNHHDAWVNGANDPVSGLVALMAEAKAVGELHRGGWTPKRTIVYAAWDGEEPGLIGSTEWVEAHADLLSRNAAVYVNSDTNGRGFLQVAGSHSLEKFVSEVARDVPDPQKGVSVFERLRARRIVRDSAEDAKEARERSDVRIAALGSGSDYTPFLQHLGIASLNIGFGGEDEGGSYHSIYDSFAHYTRFGDPDFAYGAALAKVGGRMVLRLADADVLPFEFSNAADTVRRYVDEVGKLADDMRKDTEEQNRRLADKTLEIAADPRQPFVPPPRRDPVPYINLAPLRNALAALEESADAYRRARETRDAAIPLEAQKDLDQALIATERALTREQGLPGRPWFRHQVYAPGFYTGYGVKTLPAVREALEQRRWSLAEQQAPVVAAALKGYADAIARAAAILVGPPAR